ncbi:MAG: lysine--tRNA ligase [Nanoarchaeota archaeon]|nr:lysine--tRNA ligase [Nanoarchaeota archaeon]
MGREEEILKERLRKIEELRKVGINPFPYYYNQENHAAELQEKYKKLKNESRTKDNVKVAGRVIVIRDIGKLAFISLQDGSGKIQVQIQQELTPEKEFDFFKKYIDSGDFIGVEGAITRTKRGELTVLAGKIELLSKSLRPLPEKWHGLQDKEERYRKRYLDLIMSPEVRGVFVKRSKIINAIREFLNSRDYLEVDTPVLQPIYGGAAAKPFLTHLNALDMKLYLRISNELYLKRLIVGGFERVYEFARDFRNEGIDRTHNPEFTQVELYQAYADYNEMMKICEELWGYVAKKVLGTTEIDYQGNKINLKAPWQRLSMKEAIKKYAKIDVDSLDDEKLSEIIEKNRIKSKGTIRGWMIASIFEHFCEKHLIQPTFIYDYPEETTPLCKSKRGDSLTTLVERFELYILGMEIGNAYSELNNPVKQEILLEQQAKELKKGNEEANPMDEDFVDALEVGMPPTGGLGIGIDRMVMLLTNSSSIKDVLLFPFMKPQELDN